MQGNLEHLKGWISEPYQKTRVLNVARGLSQPFLLREVVHATGLPKHVIQRVLSRAVKQGILSREKWPMSYPQTGGRRRVYIPNGKQRRVYLYKFVEGQ